MNTITTKTQQLNLYLAECEAMNRVMNTLKKAQEYPWRKFPEAYMKHRLDEYYADCDGQVINLAEDIEVFDADARWGYCGVTYVNHFEDYPYCHEIKINVRLLEDGVDKEYLINTVAHEFLHSVADNIAGKSQKHRGLWKFLADVYNSVHPNLLPITRCKNIPNIRKDEKKYIIECPECHHQWKYVRMTKAVKHPETYSCGKCKAKLVRVK